jgi:hypothetical protein
MALTVLIDANREAPTPYCAAPLIRCISVGHDRGGMNRAGKNTDCRRKHLRVCLQRLRMGLADTELFYRKFAERSHASGLRRA